jgi:predicted HTH transcriptional regulator
MTEIDIFGVPEFFTSHVGVIEDAGYGMVRLVHCITRNGVQQPVYSNVASAESILRLCRDAEAVATKVLMAGSSIN